MKAAVYAHVFRPDEEAILVKASAQERLQDSSLQKRM
jgi:hypothetical protein